MSLETEIIIASAARTPIGAFSGAFTNIAAHELGSIAIPRHLAAPAFLPKKFQKSYSAKS